MKCTEDWMKEYPGAITVSDVDGNILHMNDRSAAVFAKSGGRDLIGKNLRDYHPEPARKKILELQETHGTNTYTIEKGGIKKLIHQTPWYREGKYMGLVELSIEIPMEMPHYIRKI